MQTLQRYFIYFIIFSAVFFCNFQSTAQTGNKEYHQSLRSKAQQALAFCKAKKYNDKFCILIDLGRHSGLNRFFIWDFERNAVSQSYLVSHGCGTMPWSWAWSKEKAALSNEHGSHCSSKGKYRIGKRGYSNWGIHVNYKLHGLESTNNNAHARQIVFHSWEKVADEEVYPRGTPEGWGCPAVSNKALRSIDSKLKGTKAHVLMWIYN